MFSVSNITGRCKHSSHTQIIPISWKGKATYLEVRNFTVVVKIILLSENHG